MFENYVFSGVLISYPIAFSYSLHLFHENVSFRVGKVIAVNYPGKLLVKATFVNSNKTPKKSRLVLHSLVVTVV